MEKKNIKALRFIDALLNYQDIKDLELYDDQGVKVSAHTYDVLNISIDKILNKYKSFEDGKDRVDYFALTVGVIMHDISKSSIRRKEENLSHSQMMLKNVDYIVDEVYSVLEGIEKKNNIFIKDEIKKNILHIVLSHHGKWGKVQPQTREAKIVHKADMASAKYHRINTVEANDILKLSAKGMSLDEIEKELNCSASIIKDRLKRSKRILKVATFQELLESYKKNGKVPIGDKFFVIRTQETKKLKRKIEEEGFYNLFIRNPLMEYMVDDKIFKE